jgi:hypothetical protein
MVTSISNAGTESQGWQRGLRRRSVSCRHKQPVTMGTNDNLIHKVGRTGYELSLD